MRLTRDVHIIQWLCRQASGYFLPNLKGADEKYEDPGLATNEILQQFADLLESITTAARDRRITEEEASRIRRDWDDLKAFTEGFVRACEQGNFDQVPAAWR